MDVNRREFLSRLGLAGVGGSLACLGCDSAQAAEPPSDLSEGRGVLVDLTKCNGCRRCEAACRSAAGFDVPTEEELKDRAVFAEYRRPGPDSLTTVNRFAVEDGRNGDRQVYAKSNCLHCLDPACASACLVGAIQKQPNGAVTYEAHKCMGCRYCMIACPFQVPAYEYANALTPQVRKCTFCSNEGNPNKGGVPACVQACPKESLTFGTRSELLGRAHEKIRQHPDMYIDHVYGEHEVGGTSWLYLSNVRFEELGFLDLGSEAPPRLTEAIQHAVFKQWMPPLALFGTLGVIMWLSRQQQVQAAEQSAHAGALPVDESQENRRAGSHLVDEGVTS